MHLWLITSWKSRLVDLYYCYRVAETKTIIIPVLLQPSGWNRNKYNNLRSSSVAMNAEREWIRYRTRTWANMHQRRMTLSSNIIKAFLLPPTLVECSKAPMQNLHPSPPFKGWKSYDVMLHPGCHPLRSCVHAGCPSSFITVLLLVAIMRLQLVLVSRSATMRWRLSGGQHASSKNE